MLHSDRNDSEGRRKEEEVGWIEGRSRIENQRKRGGGGGAGWEGRWLTLEPRLSFPSSSLHRLVSDAAAWRRSRHPPWEEKRGKKGCKRGTGIKGNGGER